MLEGRAALNYPVCLHRKGVLMIGNSKTLHNNVSGGDYAIVFSMALGRATAPSGACAIADYFRSFRLGWAG